MASLTSLNVNYCPNVTLAGVMELERETASAHLSIHHNLWAMDDDVEQ